MRHGPSSGIIAVHDSTRPTPLPLAFIFLTSTAFAGDPESIAIYLGTEKIASTGGGNSNSGNGSSSGTRRQPVYLAIDTTTGDVQRVALNTRTKKFLVEAPVRFDQVFPQTGGRRSKEFARLMLVTRTTPQAGEFTNTASQYDGRTLDSVITSAGLTLAYPRVLTWSFDFQYSGFVVAPPGVTTFPQIDTGRATLSLNKPLTRAAAGKTLAQALDVIRGALTQRRYTEEQ